MEFPSPVVILPLHYDILSHCTPDPGQNISPEQTPQSLDTAHFNSLTKVRCPPKSEGLIPLVDRLQIDVEFLKIGDEELIVQLIVWQITLED